MRIDREACKGCGLCVEFCPRHSLVLDPGLNASGVHFAVHQDDGECTGCANCALVCPECGIRILVDEGTETPGTR